MAQRCGKPQTGANGGARDRQPDISVGCDHRHFSGRVYYLSFLPVEKSSGRRRRPLTKSRSQQRFRESRASHEGGYCVRIEIRRMDVRVVARRRGRDRRCAARKGSAVLCNRSDRRRAQRTRLCHDRHRQTPARRMQRRGPEFVSRLRRFHRREHDRRRKIIACEKVYRRVAKRRASAHSAPQEREAQIQRSGPKGPRALFF